VGGRSPRLTDAHIHLELYALSLHKVNCETDTRAECLQRVFKRAARSAAGDWILGHGWNQNVWAEGFGNLADLDQVAPNNPVYLTAKSYHAAWANSSALRLANLTDSSADPAGGTLGRDAQGRLNGILFENAMGLVEQAVPEPQIDQVEAAIQAALPVFWRFGLTGVHDFDRRRCFMALQNLRQRGELKLRVIKSVPLEELPTPCMGLQSDLGTNFSPSARSKALPMGPWDHRPRRCWRLMKTVHRIAACCCWMLKNYSNAAARQSKMVSAWRFMLSATVPIMRS